MTNIHNNNTLNVAIVGATGVVGRELIDVLRTRAFPVRNLRLLASARSAGTSIQWLANVETGTTQSKNSAAQSITVEQLNHHSFDDIDLAFFCASGNVSRQWIPIANSTGAVVIDNSSAFRMNPDVPLVVPEVNGDVLDHYDGVASASSQTQMRLPGIVANPNCSTIIALLAVAPLHHAAGIERMVVCTYQAASGGGAALMEELQQQTKQYAAGQALEMNAINRPYLFNVFSHNSPVGPDGSNEEETKLVRETHKILDDDSIAITATCVRVPVLRAHCEAINLTFREALCENEARAILREAPGVKIVDDRETNQFPEPVNATGCDDVHVGRIRADHSQPPGKGLNLFVAGDQLRKGAALNAVQIAEYGMNRKKPVCSSAAIAGTETSILDR